MSDSGKEDNEEDLRHEESEPSFDEEEVLGSHVEEDDDDKPSSRPLKKKRKFNRFIDIEADVGDDEEEEIEEEYDLEDMNKEELDEADEAEKATLEADNRRSYFRSLMERDEQVLDAEAEEERLRKLYGKLRADRADKDTVASIISHRALLQPQSEDPKLWLVKCKPGKERAVVASFMKHIQLLPESGRPEVFSALSRDNVKGYIYVEAYRSTEIMNLVQKCRLKHVVYASLINKPSMVHTSEMADILIVDDKKKSLFKNIELGGWVRIKRGKYAGDLAQVIEIPEDPTLMDRSTNLKIKLIPRINYVSSSSGTRPLPRLFDPQEASQYGSVTKMRGFWHYNGETFKDGYLYKDMKLIGLQVDDVTPLHSELESFNATLNEEDATGGKVDQKYSIGERVYIRNEGQQNQKKSLATIENIVEGLVHIRLDDDSNRIVLHPSKIMRFLEEGDLVYVSGNGEHAGTRGIIVQIKKDEATVFATSKQIQFDIDLDRLRRVSEVGMTVSAFDNHSQTVKSKNNGNNSNSLNIGDVVIIGESNDFGLIIKMGLEEGMAHVIIQDGSTKLFQLDSMRKANIDSSAPSKYGGGGITNGSHSSSRGTIKQNDRVLVDDQVGTVLQTYQSIAFVRLLDTNRIITRDVLGLVSANGSIGMSSAHSPYSSSSQSSFSMPYSSRALMGDAERGGGMPPRGGRSIGNPRQIIGKSVSISGGPYKGYVGIVSQIHDGMARIELHTNSKIVSVPADKLFIHGGVEERGRPLALSSAVDSRSDSKMTPAWNATKTPAWNAAKTPAHSGAIGSKTPAWNAFGSGIGGSEKTPTWNISGKTPVWSAASGNSINPLEIGKGGGKTPSWVLPHAEGRTPAWAAAPIGDGSKTPVTKQSTKGSSQTTTTNALPHWAIQLAVVKLKLGRGLETHIVQIENTDPVNIHLSGGTCVGIDEIEPVPPGKKDRVKLLGTQSCGTVVGLDGPDAVIRLDESSDFKIVALNNIVRIANP